MQRTIIIGDIHGCYAELQSLLDAVGPAPGDQIIALGDIVDRGPESERVLEFFRDTPGARSLVGNHERKHVCSARGEVRPALAQRIVREQLGERYPAWLDFMATLPAYIELPEALLVHGFFEPGVPLDRQRDVVLIGTLTGEKYITEKLPPPWYDHYDGAKPLIFGHHDYLRTGQPVVREGRVYGLDTGVVHGGRLTALVLPEFRIVSVPSARDYWAEARRAYADLATRDHADEELEWEVLAAYLARASRADGGADERFECCAALVEHCEQLAGALLRELARVRDAIEAELAAAPDWSACGPRTQAARFARRVAGHPAAALLYDARRRQLDERRLKGELATPRALFELASRLGLAPPDDEDE